MQVMQEVPTFINVSAPFSGWNSYKNALVVGLFNTNWREMCIRDRVEVILSVSSLTMFEHIPKSTIPTVENTENIITPSAGHNLSLIHISCRFPCICKCTEEDRCLLHQQECVGKVCNFKYCAQW